MLKEIKHKLKNMYRKKELESMARLKIYEVEQLCLAAYQREEQGVSKVEDGLERASWTSTEK